MSIIIEGDLLEKIRMRFKQRGDITHYWDQNDRIRASSIIEVMENENKDILDVLRLDSYEDEVYHIQDILTEFESDIKEANGIEYDEQLDTESLAREYREEFYDLFSVDY